MTSRIARGFHRIGVVLAVPVLLVGIGLAGHEAWLQWTTKDPYAAFANAPPTPASASHTPWENDPIIRHAVPVPDPYAGIGTEVQAPRPGGMNFDDITGPPLAKPGMFDDLIPKTPAYRADYTMAAIILAFAVALYAAARAVGWVLAGFVGPSPNK